LAVIDQIWLVHRGSAWISQDIPVFDNKIMDHVYVAALSQPAQTKTSSPFPPKRPFIRSEV